MKKKEYTKPEIQVVNITSCTFSLQHLLCSKEKVTVVDQKWKTPGIMVINSHYNA